MATEEQGAVLREMKKRLDALTVRSIALRPEIRKHRAFVLLQRTNLDRMLRELAMLEGGIASFQECIKLLRETSEGEVQ